MGCRASLRVGAVLNSSSHLETAGGWECHFCGMVWVPPSSEFSALAWLKQHGGARRSLLGRVVPPLKGGEEEG